MNFKNLTYFIEFLLCNQIIVVPFFFILLFWSGGIAYFFLENSFIIFMFKNFEQKCIFTNTRWPNNYKRFTLQWCRIKWMEVFFGINVNIVL